MDTLALGMQSLKIAESLSESRTLDSRRRERLVRGRDFLDGALGAINFTVDGHTEGLEEQSFLQADFACRTLAELQKLREFPEVQEYLRRLRRSVDAVLKGRSTKAQRGHLAAFFAAVGRAMVSEATVQRVMIGEEAASARHLRESEYFDTLSIVNI
jgi:hypothetical protein